MTAWLKEEGHPVNSTRVRRLMRLRNWRPSIRSLGCPCPIRIIKCSPTCFGECRSPAPIRCGAATSRTSGSERDSCTWSPLWIGIVATYYRGPWLRRWTSRSAWRLSIKLFISEKRPLRFLTLIRDPSSPAVVGSRR